MEHLAFDIFTRADLAYLREAVMHKLPSAPRPPTMGADEDIPWAFLREALAAPPAEVAALLNIPAAKPRRKRRDPKYTRQTTMEKYQSYIGERYGLLTITGYGGTSDSGPSRRHLVEVTCDCGTVFRAQRPALVAGLAKSCGCLTGRGRPRLCK